MVCLVESYSRNISVKLLSKYGICNETAINANFHFPHFKSMAMSFKMLTATDRRWMDNGCLAIQYTIGSDELK